MAKSKKARAGSSSGSDTHDEDESESLPEEKREDKAIDTPAAHPKAGTTITVGGEEVTFEDERQLSASPNSGVEAGVYKIVSVILKPGNRKAYRAVVGDALYPIREYGTENEVISKIRGKAKERKPRKAAAREVPQTFDEGAPIMLSDSAAEVLREYLAFRHEDDQDAVLSDLVETHLGPEVEKLKAAQAAISKLPIDLLTALANATDEKRQKILEALR